MFDRPRIFAALGMPLSQAEVNKHVGYAVDLFLAGCAKAHAAR